MDDPDNSSSFSSPRSSGVSERLSDAEDVIYGTDPALPQAARAHLAGNQRSEALSELVPEVKVKSTTQPLEQLRVKGRRLMTRQKFMVAAFLISLNCIFIFATWFWPRYYYLYLPFISLPLALNSCMIVSIVLFTLRNWIRPAKKNPAPKSPESMILLMPCYNETKEECTKSLDSLVAQVGIEDHRRAILVVCDGRVRGPGMDKTTGQYLNEDILVDRTDREFLHNAYTAWDGQTMSIELTRGTYKGVPFMCIVKQQNQGKRDSLLVARSFLYNFNRRSQKPKVIFSPRFFNSMSSWLVHDVGLQKVDFLIGMDADTVFAPTCISELVKESRYPHTVGVCGYVAVDFKDQPFNLWSIYQSAEYTIAQGLRRLHQSIATHKVSCLPGCCQLLRINDTTCGDLVLMQKFGYHPKPLDGMLKQIRATASEDRNHVCLMLTTFPKAQTRQALHAMAYTDVPHSWSVFLSQRRRWTLGATANDLLLVTAWGTQWWERIVAFSNVLTWCLNVFVIASIGSMIVAFISQPYWIILAFAGVMIFPVLYYVGIVLWIPRTALEKVQYLAGLTIFIVCGPFLNIAVLLFAIWNMDSFGWGKTRKVISSDDDNKAVGQEKTVSADAAHAPFYGTDTTSGHRISHSSRSNCSSDNRRISPEEKGGETAENDNWKFSTRMLVNDEESQLGLR
ncbi:chitin synthase-domain-containing protein [Xylariales sp. PMI_506]|nr:chitin synthase-domain-containing protein [Xylariales sp. PMI_506]